MAFGVLVAWALVLLALVADFCRSCWEERIRLCNVGFGSKFLQLSLNGADLLMCVVDLGATAECGVLLIRNVASSLG